MRRCIQPVQENHLFQGFTRRCRNENTCVDLTIVLLLSLVVTSSVSAGKGPRLPTWEVAFDPALPWARAQTPTTVLCSRVNCILLLGGPIPISQVWGTPDGENWSLAWEASSIQEDSRLFGP